MKLALLTDIHEDIQSLKKALILAERERCDHVVCLGDILGYPYLRAGYYSTRSASECIGLIKSNCSCVVKGNHDLFHLMQFPAHKTNFHFPAEWYSLSDNEKTRTSQGRVWHYADDSKVELTESEIEWLSGLPEFELHELMGIKLFFSHYFSPNYTGYESSLHGIRQTVAVHLENMKEIGVDVSFCGHLHIDGVGIGYESGDSFHKRILHGFRFYNYGARKIGKKRCAIGLPALADNGRENGFAIFDCNDYILTSVSLNMQRRFSL